MMKWLPGELHDAAKKVERLEAEVHRDSERNAARELEMIAESLGIDAEDPFSSPLAQLISAHYYSGSPVPVEVIRLFGDVLWECARTAERIQLDIERKCGRLSQGLPYNG